MQDAEALAVSPARRELMPLDAVEAILHGGMNNAAIEASEREVLKMEQVVCPLVHKFAKGMYLREIFMPAGSLIIGHEHTTEHFNIVLSGKARVMINGEVQDIIAPCTFVSKPGVRKVLVILEDMRWATAHVTDETDVGKLEEMLIIRSAAFDEHALEQAKQLTTLTE